MIYLCIHIYEFLLASLRGAPSAICTEFASLARFLTSLSLASSLPSFARFPPPLICRSMYTDIRTSLQVIYRARHAVGIWGHGELKGLARFLGSLLPSLGPSLPSHSHPSSFVRFLVSFARFPPPYGCMSQGLQIRSPDLSLHSPSVSRYFEKIDFLATKWP